MTVPAETRKEKQSPPTKQVSFVGHEDDDTAADAAVVENITEQDESTKDDGAAVSSKPHQAPPQQKKYRRQPFSFRSKMALPTTSGQFTWFTPPVQRQRWDETQAHPHTVWTDIFYDLFFVAAAYNLGNLLREDPTATGVLYLAGCCLPLQQFWSARLYHDSRYHMEGNDVWHFLYMCAEYAALATAVAHIRPVHVLSRPDQHVDMLILAASCTACQLLAMGRVLEVAICAQKQERFENSSDDKKKSDSYEHDTPADNPHQQSLHNGNAHDDSHHGTTGGLFPEAFASAKRDLKTATIAFVLFVAATIYAAIEYYSGHGEEKNSSGTAEIHDDDHRLLAEYPTKSQEDNTAIWLLLASSFITTFYWIVMSLFWRSRRETFDYKKTTVPMHIDYAIHRYGEWTMLLLGESVLSLVIVPISGQRNYIITFLAGVVSTVWLEYLHFRSQPHDPDEHALRQNKASAIVFTLLMMLYSCTLIVLGASFKMFLFEFVYQDEEDEAAASYENSTSYKSEGDHISEGARQLMTRLMRQLAGGTSAALRFDENDRQQRIAHLFCGSLALVWFCMDAMSLAHKGINKCLSKCVSEARKDSSQLPIVLLTLFRVGLMVWMATLSQYMTDPMVLSLLGLAGIMGQLAIRAIGFILVQPSEDDGKAELEAMEKTLQYTTARLRMPPTFN